MGPPVAELDEEPTLSYDELADRIEAVLGERPALVTLRTAVARPSRRKVSPSLTAGLPAPVTAAGTRPRFSARAVEEWLAHHPRRRQEELMAQIIAATPDRRDQVITAARDEGLSWEAIAEAAGQAVGTTYSKQWAQQKYGLRRR